MKAELIERYVYDVVRRLPEVEREEVREELTANIYEMVNDINDEAEVKAVLQKMGHPYDLANEYRLNKRYLIGPGVFDDFLGVLKKVLPLSFLFGFFLGAIVEFVRLLIDMEASIAIYIQEILQKGITTGIEMLYGAAIFTLLGFILYEHYRDKNSKKEIDFNALRKVPTDKGPDSGGFSKVDIIVDLVFSFIFGVFFILVLSDRVSVLFISGESASAAAIINANIIPYLIFWIGASLVLEIINRAVKLYYGEWSLKVFIVHALTDLSALAIGIFAFTRGPILTENFKAQVNELFINGVIKLADIRQVSENDWTNSLRAAIIIAIIGTFISIGMAAYKTFYKKAKAAGVKPDGQRAKI